MAWGRVILPFINLGSACAVTQVIAGKDIMASVNWKSGKSCTQVRGRLEDYAGPPGTTSGAAESRFEADKALAATVDPAMLALFPLRPASP